MLARGVLAPRQGSHRMTWRHKVETWRCFHPDPIRAWLVLFDERVGGAHTTAVYGGCVDGRGTKLAERAELPLEGRAPGGADS
jgi:hypothetical protein